jgi:hypothetical protein
VRETRLMSLSQEQSPTVALDKSPTQHDVTGAEWRASIEDACVVLSDKSISPSARVCFATHLPSLPGVYAHEFSVRLARLALRKLKSTHYNDHQAVSRT